MLDRNQYFLFLEYLGGSDKRAGLYNPYIIFNDLRDENAIEYGTWNHIALTAADNDSVSIYINGNKVFGDISTIERPSSSTPFSMGYQMTANGLMDEVRVWNVARTGSEIRESMYSLMSGVEDGLVACWRFDELENGVTPDITSFENHATVSESVEWVKNHVWSSDPNLYFSTAGRGNFLTFHKYSHCHLINHLFLWHFPEYL